MSDCSSCPSKSGCSSASQGGCGSSAPTFIAPSANSKIRTVVAVGSGKGGVGKSTVSALLAQSLRKKGYSVGIMDADITGPSMAQAFGIDGGIQVKDERILVPPQTESGMPLMSLNLLLEDKGEPVVWRGPVIGNVIKQFWSEVEWGILDVLILDMPPGTGDVPLTVFQSIPVDRFVVVTTPQDLVQMIVTKACRMAEKMNVPVLGLVENMAYLPCPCCNELVYPFGIGKADEVAENMGLPLLDQLVIDPNVNQLMDQGKIETYTKSVLQGTVAALSVLIDKKKTFAEGKA